MPKSARLVICALKAAQLLCHALVGQNNPMKDKKPVLAVMPGRSAVKAVQKAKHAPWDLHAQREHLSKRRSLALQGPIRINRAAAYRALKAFTATSQQTTLLVENVWLLAEPSGPCSGGFICISRSTSPRPTGEENGSTCDENMSGRPCRKGHYCPRPESPLIAGTGFAGSGSDGLPGPETLLMLPASAVMDSNTGDIYVADYGNYAVKVVRGETGMWDLVEDLRRNAIVEHDVASRSSVLMSKISTQISKPLGLDVDEDCSHLYIADSGNHRVLKHELAGSQGILTVIGTGTAGKGDPGTSTSNRSFQLNMPSGVALHNTIVYVVDSGNKRVLKVNTDTDSVEELPGSGANNSPGNGQNSSGVVFERPVSAAIADGEADILLVVADLGSRALRQIDIQANTISPLVDYSIWRSPVVSDAEISIATTGIEEAFYGVSSFYGEGQKRIGVLLADSYTHRIRRIDLGRDLYAQPAVSDVACPAGTITAKAKRPSTTGLPMWREAFTDLELAANAGSLSSGWFRRRGDAACCIGETKCPHRASTNQDEEEVFVVDLEEPIDLIGIRIQLDGDHSPTALSGVEVKHENGRSTLCGPFYGFDGSARSTPYTFRVARRRISHRNKSTHRIIDTSGEKLKGVTSVIFRFVPGAQSVTAFASLTSKATRERGATTHSGECSAGYYCKNGSWTATPLAGMVHPETGEVSDIGDICPPNHYCTKGVSEPTPCPRGTFSHTGGVTSVSGCFKCSPGFACISEGVQVPCAEGYVCLEGSNQAVPDDPSMGHICPAGHYCPEGSFAEKARELMLLVYSPWPVTPLSQLNN
ncbi:hypothetical protein EBH_0056350 [Eimeria brunetti]|uniref:Cytadherence high molecular weight protein 2, related n=1 Tax=Eimeria brunetti TaxID=51314 RepID=U6LFU3_9EIME|nr:hypothetical protein EBH_0056350 [Eimeria brunetti]